MVKKINSEQFEQEAKAAEIAVVDFSATWCGPCKMLAPVLEKVSEVFGDRVTFFNVDVDEAPELAAAYKVQSVPCLVLMKKGEFVDQTVGFAPEAVIADWVEENI